jgi:VanZ family protein
VPALLWLLLVAIFSSTSAGASNTLIVLEKLLAILHIKLAWHQLIVAHYLIRKTAHFVSYAILGALLFRAFRGTDRWHRGWRTRWAVFALGIALLVSSSDEIHQFFTPGRQGKWQDVALDMMGAGFAQICLLLASLRDSRSASR